MSWEEKRLGDVLTLKRGYDLTEAQRKPGDVPVVSSSGITGSHNVAMVDGPGVVTGRYGTMGEVFYIERDFWPHNTALYVRDFRGNDPRFIAYFLKIVLRGAHSNKAAVPGVNRNDLHERKVVVPDVSTQKRIVEQLLPLDELIDNNRRRIKLLEESTRLLYREWFVHLRFPGHEHGKIVDGVPDGWSRKPLGSLCKLRAGDTFKPGYQGRTNGDIPFIKVRDLSRDGNSVVVTGANNWVSKQDCTECRWKPFPAGTSVFAKIGEGLRQNRIRILARDTLIDNNMMGAIPRYGEVESTYLHLLFRTLDLSNYAGGAAIPFLSSRVLESIEIVEPTMPILREFQSLTADLFKQIEILEAQNEVLCHTRDLLLPRLMSGEIAV